MNTIRILVDGVCTETIKIRSEPQEYMLYRGRLFQTVLPIQPNGDAYYVERQYLEVS